MEKRRPSYDLEAIKRQIDSIGALTMTRSATMGASHLGFDRAAVVGVIQTITRGMFVKSMTTYANHRLWQDVYHVPHEGLMLYIKFQTGVIAAFEVVSFKER